MRFTRKGQTLYAFLMGWPEKETVIQAFSSVSAKVENVQVFRPQHSIAGMGARVRVASECNYRGRSLAIMPWHLR